jgi:Icc protein
MPQAGPFDALPPGSLRIVQLTDTHLYADPAGCLLGLNTLNALDAVLDLTQQLGPTDLVLATGDLVHDASAAGYSRLRERLSGLDAPVYCLPGNHDLPGPMREHLTGGRVEMPPWVRRDGWLLVFLDSTVPEEDGGHLRPEELDRLEATLQGHPEQHCLICLHHHPLATGSSWMDSMAVDNADQLLAIVESHPQVRGLLWGHIHQEFDLTRRGVRFLGSPSTCIQFTPNKHGFGVDSTPPGYRWLVLQPDGQIQTGVARLDSLPGQVNLASAGY